MEPHTISVIFGGANASRTLAAAIGLIESGAAKLDRLSRAPLESACRNLEQARDAIDEERTSLLREARGQFNKAVAVESKPMRQAKALLGLATCHHLLQDHRNCDTALLEVLSIVPALSFSSRTKLFAQGEDAGPQAPGLLGAFAFGAQTGDWRRAVFGSFVDLFPLRRATSRTRTRWRIALEMDDEAARLFKIQTEISEFTGHPITWWEAAKPI
jgi:hypothetical protein